MQRRRSALGVAVVASLVLVACGGSEGDDEGAGTSDAAEVAIATDPTDATDGAGTDPGGADEDALDERSTDTAPPANDASTVSTTSTTVFLHVDSTVGFLPFLLPLLPTLDIDPGPDGAGRPTFSWEAVDGAADYTVIVAADGQSHWAITTDVTSATVGDGLDPLAVGPRVDDTMRWYVYARDAAGEPIAQSVGQPVPTMG